MKKGIAVLLSCRMLLIIFLSAFLFTGCGSVIDKIEELLDAPEGACFYDTDKCIVVAETICTKLQDVTAWVEGGSCIGS